MFSDNTPFLQATRDIKVDLDRYMCVCSLFLDRYDVVCCRADLEGEEDHVVDGEVEEAVAGEEDQVVAAGAKMSCAFFSCDRSSIENSLKLGKAND